MNPSKCIILPTHTMYQDEIAEYVKCCRIQNFRGALMRDELNGIQPSKPVECGILNLNRHDQQGSHWISWVKLNLSRYYFDSYGERPPVEILKYLKSREEYEQDIPAIHCNAITVQHNDSQECGALSIYVIYYILKGHTFESILQKLEKRYNKSIPSPPLKICL